jgi:glycopeptide antibiotics resistance protein
VQAHRARSRVTTVIIWLGFALYLAFLLKLLLLSRPIGSERSVNLIPFATILDYARGGSHLAFGNVVGNVLAFAPLGAYLPVLTRRMRVGRNLLVVVATSVAAEIIQCVLGLGSSDIDDVILNSTGGLIGILIIRLLARLGRDRMRGVVAVLAVLSILVLGWLLFALRLRM